MIDLKINNTSQNKIILFFNSCLDQINKITPLQTLRSINYSFSKHRYILFVLLVALVTQDRQGMHCYDSEYVMGNCRRRRGGKGASLMIQESMQPEGKHLRSACGKPAELQGVHFRLFTLLLV